MTTPKINARLEHVKRSPADRRAAADRLAKVQESLNQPHASMVWSEGGLQGSMGIHTVDRALARTLKDALERRLLRLEREMQFEHKYEVRREYVREAIQAEIGRCHDLLNFTNEMLKVLLCDQSLPQLKEEADAS